MTNKMIEKGAKELLAEKFQAIEPEITAEDRKEAEATLGLSAPTLTKYIGGDVSKPEIGLTLYEFFRERITRRIERIKSIA
jgi:hypothetical protein